MAELRFVAGDSWDVKDWRMAVNGSNFIVTYKGKKFLIPATSVKYIVFEADEDA